MDNQKIAKELVKLAKELQSKRTIQVEKTIYDLDDVLSDVDLRGKVLMHYREKIKDEYKRLGFARDIARKTENELERLGFSNVEVKIHRGVFCSIICTISAIDFDNNVDEMGYSDYEKKYLEELRVKFVANPLNYRLVRKSINKHEYERSGRYNFNSFLDKIKRGKRFFIEFLKDKRKSVRKELEKAEARFEKKVFTRLFKDSEFDEDGYII